MEDAIYGCPRGWAALLPPGVRRLRERSELAGQAWGVLVLTPDGCHGLQTVELSCKLLLLPGNVPAGRLPRLRNGCAASYGLSPRDSLTFSSLQEPLLCIQRALPGPRGTVIEPQEIPLPGLPAPAEEFLPLLALWLWH